VTTQQIACVMPSRRTATVISMDYTQLFVLSKRDLDCCLDDNPAMRTVLEQRAVENVKGMKIARRGTLHTCCELPDSNSKSFSSKYRRKPRTKSEGVRRVVYALF